MFEGHRQWASTPILILTLSRMTLSKMTLSKMTLSKITLLKVHEQIDILIGLIYIVCMYVYFSLMCYRFLCSSFKPQKCFEMKNFCSQKIYRTSRHFCNWIYLKGMSSFPMFFVVFQIYIPGLWLPNLLYT